MPVVYCEKKDKECNRGRETNPGEGKGEGRVCVSIITYFYAMGMCMGRPGDLNLGQLGSKIPTQCVEKMEKSRLFSYRRKTRGR